jgi:hypothetical protein
LFGRFHHNFGDATIALDFTGDADLFALIVNLGLVTLESISAPDNNRENLIGIGPV